MAVREIERESREQVAKTGWISRAYTEADGEDVCNSLAQEYPDSDVGLPEFFDWQCNQNPAGRAVIRVAYECQQNQIVGQIWGLPMRIQVDRQVHYATLIINGLVRQDFRRQGVLTRIGRESLSDAWDQRGIGFTIAVPSPASYRVDTKYLYATDLGRIPLLIKALDWAALLTYKTGRPGLARMVASPLQWITPPVPRAIPSDGITLHGMERFDESFDALWERTRHKCPVAVVRDGAWLNWRYKDIPTRHYDVMIAREKADLLGYIVTRPTTLEGVECGMIVDLWVEPTPRGQQAARLLARAATETFARRGMQIAGALMLPGTGEYTALRRTGYRVCPKRLEPQSFPLTIRWHDASVPRYPLDDLSCWFFTMGDYDVI